MSVHEANQAGPTLEAGHEVYERLIERAPFGVLVVDHRFRLSWASAVAARVLRNVTPLIGRDYAEVLRLLWPEPLASDAIARFRHTLETGEALHEADTTERRADTAEVESYEWMLERVTLPNGSPAVVCYFSDVTERRAAERNAWFLLTLAERLRVADDEGEVLSDVASMTAAHLGAERCFVAEVVGDSLVVRREHRADDRRLVGEHPISGCPTGVVSALRAGETLAIDDASIDDRTAAGHAVGYPLLAHRAQLIVPLVREGAWAGCLVVSSNAPRVWLAREVALLQDVVERVWNAIDRTRLHDRLRESEERLVRAQRAGRVGVWDWDMVSGEAWWSDYAWELFAPDGPRTRVTYERWLAVVHPDDRQRVARVVGGSAASGVYRDEFRLAQSANGDERWVEASGRFDYVDGHPVRMLGTVRDISEQIRQARALTDTDRRKNEFLAMLAHELRNPLVPIRNAAYLLQLSGATDEKARQLSGIVERQVGRLEHLVDDLVEMSRVARGMVVLRRHRVELDAVIADAVETSRPLIDEARQHLHVQVSAESMPLDADAARLVQVVVNLLNNASRYSPAEGRIDLTAHRDGADGVIVVRDTGLGIPPDMLTRIFDPFTQITRGHARAQVGLGIGLALVRSLVELHGGRVEARSDGPDRGSEFIVRLPLAPGDGLERRAEHTRQGEAS